MSDKARHIVLPLLLELRGKIKIEVARTAALKEAQDVQVFSALAGAVVALRILPTRLNPLIRSAMNGLKYEINLEFQTRAARTVASFIDLCTSQDIELKVNPADKVIKNICTFLCQDTTLTPIFARTRYATQDTFAVLVENNFALSFKKGPVELSRKHVLEPKNGTVEDDSAMKARLVRRGAELAVTALSNRFHERIFLRIPKLWICMTEALFRIPVTSDIRAADHIFAEGENGQDLLDCLTVLSAVTPSLSPTLHSDISRLFPKLVLAIQSDFVVVRQVAARCFAVLCNTIPDEGMRSVIVNVVPFFADPLSISRRYGAVELTSREWSFGFLVS